MNIWVIACTVLLLFFITGFWDLGFVLMIVKTSLHLVVLCIARAFTKLQLRYYNNRLEKLSKSMERSDIDDLAR